MMNQDLIPGQVSLFDLPGLYEPPELWDCMATCIHAGGPWDDHFPGSDKRRCRYPDQIPGMSNGRNMISKTIDNRWHCWCRLYERRETGFRLP